MVTSSGCAELRCTRCGRRCRLRRRLAPPRVLFEVGHASVLAATFLVVLLLLDLSNPLRSAAARGRVPGTLGGSGSVQPPASVPSSPGKGVMVIAGWPSGMAAWGPGMQVRGRQRPCLQKRIRTRASIICSYSPSECIPARRARSGVLLRIGVRGFAGPRCLGRSMALPGRRACLASRAC